ncbi:MAG TPA: malate/lactate/ureidoglycolate dehydrogenase [Arenibaculum sp.]|nr:malate/lactate/ureidoglycolate dehydrogenase [Arenibaculum sp.]
MLIDHLRLTDMVCTILEAAGSGEEEAAIVAGHLVEANLTGHDSHGVGMLPRYVAHRRTGLLEANRHAQLVRDEGAVLVFDGGMGYGQVVTREAVDLAITRARETGVAALGMRNAHHMGRIGSYGEQCARADMVGLFFVNVTGHTPLVAPFRGTDARMVTNPLCLALPAMGGKPMIVLDFATSKVALGKCRVAMNKGEPMPEDTLLDGAGRPTTDPAVMFGDGHGALLPFGMHKGYGLALFCEILGGILAGGGTIQPENPRNGSIVNNMTGFVLDPGRLGDRDWMGRELAALVDHVKASPPADPQQPVLVPGEVEATTRARRLEEGIPIDPATWRELGKAARSLGVGGAIPADPAA